MATEKQYLKRIAELESRLQEAEETLEAIRSGCVDAIVVSGQQGEKIFTLQGADQSYRTLVESINEGALTLSSDGTILYGNERFADMTGLPLDRIIGTAIGEHLSNGKGDFARQLFSGDKPEKARFTASLRTREGGELPVLVSGSVTDIAGERIITAVIADLTEQIRSQEVEEQKQQLAKANEELESFAYSVSHDLRAPLRAIEGFSRIILKRAGNLDEETKRQFNVIRSNADLMGKLIEDLLDFSRLGRQELRSETIDMGGLLQLIWEELRSANPDRRMALTIREMPTAWGDPALIRQVLVNLLSNAVKFTRSREEALIEAGACVAGPATAFYIRDNGAGFDMQYRDKLFKVFQRLHRANEFEGTGAGLAIVQRIIQRHGGRVWADGEVDKGASFYFSLPGK